MDPYREPFEAVYRVAISKHREKKAMTLEERVAQLEERVAALEELLRGR